MATPTSSQHSATRPPSPSPSRSLRSRVGTLMRRTSTGLAFTKGPGLHRADSKSSLKVDAALAPHTTNSAHTVPSPVAESPAREAEAEHEAAIPHLGPSPLQQTSTAPDSSDAVPTIPKPEPEPELEPAPPVFTAEPEEISAGEHHPEIVVAPEEHHVDVAEPVAPAIEDLPPRALTPEIPAVPNVAVLTVPQQPPAPPPVVERDSDYFAWKDDAQPTVAPKKSATSLTTDVIVPETTAPPQTQPEQIAVIPLSEDTRGKAESVDPRAAEIYAWRDEPAVSPKPSMSSINTRASSIERRISPPPARYGGISTRGSRSSLASSYGHVTINAPGKHVSVSVDADGEVKRGRSSSVRVSIDDPYADPFADPAEAHDMPVPHHVLSPVQSLNMPEASPSQPSAPLPHSEETYSSGWISAPVSMPLPPMQDVIMSSKTLRQTPSSYSIGERQGPAPAIADGVVHHEVDERSPLLQHFAMPSTSNNAIALAYPPGRATSRPTTAIQSLQSLGWTEYNLPDSSFYYTHSASHVVTDIDLHNRQKLDEVTKYVDNKLMEEVNIPSEEWELWLRDASGTKCDFVPVRNWVCHRQRMLSFDPPPSISEEGHIILSNISDDDKLDMEYRYWAFLEGHPAHTRLPDNAHTEAVDALTWCYTECLLPSSRPSPPPFMPQECQELMSLLKTFPSDAVSVVHTRIVARVILRVVQWRQSIFRPNKPLPHDADKSTARIVRRIPFRRALLDFGISCLCLGIPYLFLDRSHHQRMDEEGGLHRSGSMVVVGAGASLMAAIVLSASVTLISLPGLDDISRLAGLVAILFSASSMVSSVIALFRYKADIERTVVYVGGEGLMVLSRRSVVMSLPLVFLAWALAAFVTGVTFYSFRGVTVTTKATIKHPFDDFTHWAVVGTMGALAGMLVVSALVARR